MIGRLNHIAIVVPDLEKATKQYEDLFGVVVSLPQNLHDHGVTVVFIELPNTKIELLTSLNRVLLLYKTFCLDNYLKFQKVSLNSSILPVAYKNLNLKKITLT